MYGAAPKRSRVGSQVERVTKSFTPTFPRAGTPRRESSATIRAATSSTPRPRTVSRTAQARSGRLRRAAALPDAGSGSRSAVISLAGSKDGLSIHGHSLDRLFHLLHHRLRQRRVVQGRRALLALVLGPPDELQQRLSLLRILLVPVDEQISESGDRIRVLAGLVGDGDPVVLGKLHLRRRGGDAVQRRLDPAPVVVLELGSGQLVLIGVGQLHVADGAFVLLHQAGDALVALAAQPRRPVHAGGLAGTGLPLRRDLGEIVGEDAGGARADGEMRHADGRVEQLRGGVVLPQRLG